MKLYYTVVQQRSTLQCSLFTELLTYWDGDIMAAHIDTDGEIFRISSGVVEKGEFIDGGENGT